jgi:hypothetical protein
MQETVMKQFIPFSDEWFDQGLPLPGPLVPYCNGMRCVHELEREPDPRMSSADALVDREPRGQAAARDIVPVFSSGT